MIFKVLWEFLTSPHHLIRAHNLSPRNPNNSIAIRPVSRRDTHSIPATHYTGENTCAICIHTSNYRAPVRPRTKPCSLLFCSCLSSTISHLQGILSGCMGIREEEREREREYGKVKREGGRACRRKHYFLRTELALWAGQFEVRPSGSRCWGRTSAVES